MFTHGSTSRPELHRTGRRVALVGIFATLFAHGPGLGAQETRTITFEQAVDVALQRNTAVLQAANGVTAADAAVRQAKLDFLPDLKLNLSSGQTFGRTFDQNQGQIVDQTVRSLSTGVSTSVTLFDGLSGVAGLKQASRTYDAGVLDLERTRQTIVFTVASDFLALIEQREQLRVQRENLASAEALEGEVREYVDAGKRTIADLYQQQATVASARYDVVSAERAVQLAEVDLVQALQLEPGGMYDFQAPDIEAPSSVAVEAEALQTLLNRAYTLRADFSAEEARKSAAEQGVKVSASSRWPTISLAAGYNSGYSSLGLTNFSDQLDQRRSGQISLGISVPLFDRGATSTATERARLAVDNAALAIEDARQEIGVQVVRAWQDQRSSGAQLDAAAAGAEAAVLALQAAQDRYEAGAATLVEVTQARTAQVQAAATLVSARYGLLFQGLLLHYYVGELDPETVTLG